MAKALVPYHLAYEQAILPVKVSDTAFEVIISDPNLHNLISELKLISERRVITYTISTPEGIQSAIDQFYPTDRDRYAINHLSQWESPDRLKTNSEYFTDTAVVSDDITTAQKVRLSNYWPGEISVISSPDECLAYLEENRVDLLAVQDTLIANKPEFINTLPESTASRLRWFKSIDQWIVSEAQQASHLGRDHSG